jgi:hypothetical protein
MYGSALNYYFSIPLPAENLLYQPLNGTIYP